MKRTLILLLISLGSLQGLRAAVTTLEGVCSGFAGRSVRLSACSDLVTNRMEVLAGALVGDDGRFILYAEISDTLEVTLSIGFRKARFFMVPGRHYFCRIPVSGDSLRQVRQPAVEQVLPLALESLPDNDINRLTGQFDQVFDPYVARMERALLGGRNRKLLDSLYGLLPGDLLRARGTFQGVYAEYRLAGLESMVLRYDPAGQYRRYLRDRPVRYKHPAYMDFFNEFFSGYLLRKTGDLPFSDLEVTINRAGSLPALTDSLGKDSLLRNERIRQLVLLKNLGELYSDGRFSKENILALIGEIARTTRYPEHRTIAANLLVNLTHLSAGSRAPGFSLTTSQGVEKTLDDYRGQYVYLGFFTTWCQPCLPELKAIGRISSRFGEDVRFIGICADEEAVGLSHFLASNRDIDWDVYHFADTYELLESYGAYAYPLFVLLDREGRIVQYPALKPSEGMEAYLMNLLTREPPAGKN